jgi:DNA-binding phage protein
VRLPGRDDELRGVSEAVLPTRCRNVGNWRPSEKARASTASRANMDGIAAETMNRVAKAAEKIEKLEPRLEAARAELYAAIRDAHAEGAGLATIARVAGYSREWVRRIVDDQ